MMRQFFQSKRLFQPFAFQISKSLAKGSTSSRAFSDAGEAFTFIAKWNGASTHELLSAITCVRTSGGFLKNYLPDVITHLYNKSFPADLPTACRQGPIWAVDANGFALVGMAGSEVVHSVEEIKKKLNDDASL